MINYDPIKFSTWKSMEHLNYTWMHYAQLASTKLEAAKKFDLTHENYQPIGQNEYVIIY